MFWNNVLSALEIQIKFRWFLQNSQKLYSHLPSPRSFFFVKIVREVSASKFYFNSIVLAKREINLIKVVHSVVNIPNFIIHIKFAMQIIKNNDFKT